MKIYTKGGDFGETGLADGSRVSKNSLRVETYGEVDELNALLGVIRIYAHQEEYQKVLEYLQNTLFIVGSDLATANVNMPNIPRLQKGEVEKLEKWIDQMDSELPKLQNFILPGGNVVAAYLHLARSFCRRVERMVVALKREEAINDEVLVFINRLSDLLFVMARHVNMKSGIEEHIWKRP